MKRFREFIEEEVPANSAGTGNIAGLGVGAQGEPGVLPKARKKHKQRAQGTLVMLPLVRRILNKQGLGPA